MVLEPLAPCTRLTLLGPAEIVKFGLGAVTVSCTVVVWVTDPSVPVTVRDRESAAEGTGFAFSVALVPAVTDGGVREARAPLGVLRARTVTVLPLPAPVV